MNDVQNATVVPSPRQRRLAALAATGLTPWLRTIVRASVPGGHSEQEYLTVAEPVVRALFEATGLPPDEPFGLSCVGDVLTLDLPAAGADEATALAVLREILGAGTEGDAVPYDAAARWWDELSNGSAAGTVREFWRARAAGWAHPVPPLLRDPGTSPASPMAEVSAVLDDSVVAGLRRTQAPLHAWLLAGWHVLLRKHIDRDEVVVGVATDLRAHEELSGCRGPLTAHLPVRARVPLSAPLAEHAAAAATDIAEGAERAEWFDWTRVLGDRSAAERPLPYGFDAIALPAPWDTPHGPARVTALVGRGDAFTLSLHCQDAGDQVTLRIDHDSALVAASAAADLLDELTELLADALATPDRPARDLRLCPPDMAGRLRDWGTGPAMTLPEGGLPGLVRVTASDNPQASACRDGEHTLTYGGLVSRMDGLAAALRERGVSRDQVVAVSLPPGADLLVALLAVQAAGGAYTYLDPNQPPARLATLAEEAVARLVITGADTEPPVPGLPVLAVDASGTSVLRPPPLDALAYVIHTSGSTGAPKGVQVTHRGLLNYLLGIADDWACPADTLVSTPAAFDLTVPALYLPLLSGGTVTFGPPGTADPAVLADELSTNPYDLVRATPSQLRTLRTELAERAAEGAPTPPRTRCVAVGGEPLPAALARDWAATAPDTALLNYYGPTETVGARTHGPAEPANAGPTGTIPLGEPVANTTLLVLDAGLRPCPPGVTGELYIGGDGLARGYGRRPGATAERFVPDADGPPGARLYRTGDLVRWLPGRRLEFVARADDQVKIRGHRVEPAEVAAVLADHPGVAGVVVTTWPGADEVATLVAYAVAKADPVPSDELRAHAATRLPEHMLPASVRWLDALPLGPNGKLDRSALPEPGADRPELTVAYTAPRTETERVLAEVWADALGLERVGVHDDFYAIGGDSILSILVASRAAKHGLKLALRDFFAHKTIAAMAPYAEPVAATTGPRTAPPGLTPVQHWFFEQDLPHPGHWNQGWLLAVDGDVDTTALGDAVAAVVGHHPALHTTFPGQRPVRGEAPSAFRHLPVTPESWADGLTDGLTDGLADALAQLQDIDVSAGPMLRVGLVDGGPDRRRLALIAHHLVIDTVSWQLVFEDLDTAYRQAATGQEISLPAPSLPPDQWGGLLAGAVEKASSDLDYWLAQSPPDLPRLPVDRAAPPPRHRDLRAVEAVLDAPRTTRLLRELPADVRVDHVLTAAVALAITAWTGQPHLHLTVESQGRDGHDLVPDGELHRSVGWFTALAPVLVRLPGTGPLETLRAVRDQLQAVPRDGLSHGVLRYLDPDHGARLAALPVPQVSVNYVGHTGSTARSGSAGLRLRPAPESLTSLLHPESPRERLWIVNAVVREERLHVGIDYSGAHYEPGTADRLAENIRRHLAELVDAWAEAGGLSADFRFPAADRELLESALASALARAPRRPAGAS